MLSFSCSITSHHNTKPTIPKLFPSYFSFPQSNFQAIPHQPSIAKFMDIQLKPHKFCLCFQLIFLPLSLSCALAFCSIPLIQGIASNIPKIKGSAPARMEEESNLPNHKRNERMYTVSIP
jgi:hypothetical protein